MTTEVIPRPSRSYRPRRAVLVAALAFVVLALIAAGVVALTRSGESGTRASTVQRAVPTASVESCPGDGGALMVIVASMPVDISNDIMSRVSAPTRALIASAVELSAITRTTPEALDAATLSAALSRVGSADAALLTSWFSSQTQDALLVPADGSACSE
jgi:hypothetical protein